MSISISIVRSVLNEAALLGVETDRLFDAAGVDARVMDADHGRLEFVDSRRIVAAAIELSGRPELGLWVGARAPLGSLELIAPSFEFGPTLRSSLAFFERFGALVADGVRLEVIETGASPVLRFHTHVTSDATSRRFWSEHTAALTARILRGTLGPVASLRAVRFEHERIAPMEVYRDFLFLDPTFGASRNELVLADGSLDRRRMHVDEALVRFSETRAAAVLASLAETTRLATRVAELLSVERDFGSVAAGSVACRLGVSERTLRRRLKAESTSWSALFDQERERRACVALSETTVPIKELSDQLGFSETSAFVRAFKRWTAMTPAGYRRRA